MKRKLLFLNFFAFFALSSAQNTKGEVNTYSCETEKQKSIFNVKCYKAKGDGTTDDTSAIKTAITAAGSKGKIVYFPSGKYKITQAVTITSSVVLQGNTANSSVIIPHGNFDAFTFTGGSMGAGARDLHILGDYQTGGTCISVSGADRTGFSNLIITNPFNAFSIINANICSIRQCWVNAVKGEYGIRYYGNSTLRSDVLDLDNVQLSGRNDNLTSTGIIIDGNVHTTDMRHVACVAFGRGLWMKNSAGYGFPAFLQAYDFQVDYSHYEAVRIDSGEDIFFTDLYAHGSQNSDGIFVGTGVMNVHFQGAKITSHKKAGIYSNGKYVNISNCGIFNNNVGNMSASALELGSESLGNQISNNLLGRRQNYGSSYTDYGISIKPGASQIIISSNNITGNTLGSISGAPTNSVIANNITQ